MLKNITFYATRQMSKTMTLNTSMTVNKTLCQLYDFMLAQK